jgi:CopG family transcriptional regulator/antitoxin EndoAI
MLQILIIKITIYMSKRINIILPDKTAEVLDKVASKGNRSSLISEAVLYYVRIRGAQMLKDQLKAGYIADANESLKVAAEWFPLEEEAWQKSNNPKKKSKQ